jgi:hypothetical protein
MTLVTGNPFGTIETAEDLYIAGAPLIYFQDYSALPMYRSSTGSGSSAFYWQLSGSATYPVHEIGCPLDVSLADNITINEVRCDNVGVKSTVQQRNYLELTFTVQSLFPLSILTHMLRGGTVSEAADVEGFGFGDINNDQYWMVYAPRVYNETDGDYVVIHLHKAQFIDAWTLNMPWGTSWTATGIKLRAYADTTKPSAQKFGVFLREDASVLA